MHKRLLLLPLCILISFAVQAKLWMPSIFSDHMVLQQQSEAVLWGWTTMSTEELTIEASWLDAPLKTKAFQGKWSIKVPTTEAGGPYTLVIRGHETLEFENVMLGEVWLLSGQSNMEWPPRAQIENGEEEINNANYPKMRFFHVPRHRAATPQQDSYGTWAVCTPETMSSFSAIGYFFARDIMQELDVPVGLIGSYWGGSSVEVWMEKELIEASEELKKAAATLAEPGCCPQKDVGEVYNAMIAPITSYPIAGALWYQGESNRQNPFSYYITFPLMIDAWRKAWGDDFPFYYAQIAPFRYGKDDDVAAAVVRDAQLSTMLNMPNTGMVVTNDIGNLEDIHPRNKQEVGRRFALWALAKTYGMKDMVFSGPIYKDMTIDKNKIVLQFDHVNGGLVANGKELTEFYIAGSDKQFYPAKAKIKGNTIVVQAKEVKEPVAVRFAFTDVAVHNLFNEAGLPASPFRTDDWDIDLDD